jgi:hypothetical protein
MTYGAKTVLRCKLSDLTSETTQENTRSRPKEQQTGHGIIILDRATPSSRAKTLYSKNYTNTDTVPSQMNRLHMHNKKSMNRVAASYVLCGNREVETKMKKVIGRCPCRPAVFHIKNES